MSWVKFRCYPIDFSHFIQWLLPDPVIVRIKLLRKEHSFKSLVRGNIFTSMTFKSLFVHTYGFQHYMTLTWIQWQSLGTGCVVLKQKDTSRQELSEITLLRILKWKISIPTIYFWNQKNISRIYSTEHIEHEIQNTIVLGLSYIDSRLWNDSDGDFDWHFTTKAMIKNTSCVAPPQ